MRFTTTLIGSSKYVLGDWCKSMSVRVNPSLPPGQHTPDKTGSESAYAILPDGQKQPSGQPCTNAYESSHGTKKEHSSEKKKADTMRKKGGQPKKLHISINRVRVTEQQGVRDEDAGLG